jgi:hypothetical protein
LYEAERLLPRFSGSCEIYSEEYNENAKLIHDFLTNDEESYTWYHECVKSFDFSVRVRVRVLVGVIGLFFNYEQR